MPVFPSVRTNIAVGYDPQSYVTSEGAGSVDLTIRVFSHPGGAPRPFSLLVNTEDGTASMSTTIIYNLFSSTQQLLTMIMYQSVDSSYSSMLEMSLKCTLFSSMMMIVVKRSQMRISSPTPF